MKSNAYNVPVLPAPWQLTGRGYTFVYRFPRAFALEQGLIPEPMRAHFTGGFGALMLVDYTSSNCGPYYELLFIPGQFKYHGAHRPSITRIFVSSMESVLNGRRNWGIPKDQADFQVTKDEAGIETWVVRFQGREVFRARIGAGIIPFPMHSALTPNHLLQSWEKQVYFTKLSAIGYGRRARLLEIKGNGQDFPDLSQHKPFLGLGVKLDRFRMTFHVPQVIPEVKP